MKNWIEERNSRGWHRDVLSGRSFRGEEAQAMLREQEKFLATFDGMDIEPEMRGDDLLMWIGHNSYETIGDFIAEADEMNDVSKRISRIPKGIVLGESRVFLAHDEGISGDAVIFGYITVEGAEQIVWEAGETTKDVPEWVRAIPLDDTYTEQPRGGKLRDEGGSLYLVGEFTELEEYIDYNRVINPEAKRFRSYKRVRGEDILCSGMAKEAPTERAQRTINIPITKLPLSGTKWTELEISELDRLVAERDSIYQAFKEFARQTNRSIRSIEYQWFSREAEEVEDEL